MDDDALREKVAEAIDGAWTREVVGRVAHLQAAADAAIEAMCGEWGGAGRWVRTVPVVQSEWPGVSAAPAPPEQEQPDRNPEPWPTDEDVERVARVMADRSAATSWGGQSDVGRQMWLDEARAVLAAVGPKEGTDG